MCRALRRRLRDHADVHAVDSVLCDVRRGGSAHAQPNRDETGARWRKAVPIVGTTHSGMGLASFVWHRGGKNFQEFARTRTFFVDSQVQPCDPRPCFTYEWHADDWTACNVTVDGNVSVDVDGKNDSAEEGTRCGQGVRTRRVTCRRSDAQDVDAMYCNATLRPSEETLCGTPCPKDCAVRTAYQQLRNIQAWLNTSGVQPLRKHVNERSIKGCKMSMQHHA